MKNQGANNKDYAILILSCDKYSDIWEPFFSQFHKFWPECPFRVYLGSNAKTYIDKRVQSVRSMTSVDWSSDLSNILGKIKEEYIFVWMEDLLLIDHVDTKLFQRSFHFMQKSQANHMHMSPLISPDGIMDDRLFGSYKESVPYRVNAPGFWKKSHLRELLIPGENPWKFEVMGSYRSSYYGGYYCLMRQLFQFVRVVEKGNIRRGAYEYCLRNGIKLDTRYRHVDSEYERLKSDAAEYIFNGIVKIPWRLRVRTMDTLRRALASY